MYSLQSGLAPARQSTPDKLLHIHIPKTAGTSMRGALVDHFGAHDVLYYDATLGAAIRSSQRLTGSERNITDIVKSAIYKSGLYPVARPFFAAAKRWEGSKTIQPCELSTLAYRALSGHFSANDITAWGLEGAPAITIVRDPLERALSHYRHYARTNGQIFPDKEHFDTTHRMDIDEFLEQPWLTNTQTRYLGGLANVRVGTIETAQNLLEEVGVHAPLSRLNQSPNPDAAQPSATAIALFRTANTADYELFESAQAR